MLIEAVSTLCGSVGVVCKHFWLVNIVEVPKCKSIYSLVKLFHGDEHLLVVNIELETLVQWRCLY